VAAAQVGGIRRILELEEKMDELVQKMLDDVKKEIEAKMIRGE
jgi:hypothetical protein